LVAEILLAAFGGFSWVAIDECNGRRGWGPNSEIAAFVIFKTADMYRFAAFTVTPVVLVGRAQRESSLK
jgi:hypothetical protein